MDTNMRCPRCQTDLISSFPFGFVKKRVGPSSTYICSACRFLFAMCADLDKKEPGAEAKKYNTKSRSSVPLIGTIREETIR